uniref:Uncharacterized protein n=1 Tax=Anopheles epiroticus TaxID=199890 RepID=A0A182PMU2_9DIPT
MITFGLLLVSSVALLSTTVAIPVAQNGTGLGAALNSIANSLVVVSEDVEQRNNSNSAVVQQDTQSVIPHLESANVLPSLVHISLTAEDHHIKAETAELVYTNETDAQGVIKITIVSEEDGENQSGDFTTDTTTVLGDNDGDDVTTQGTITESDDQVVTESSTSKSLPTVGSIIEEPILTVLGVDQVDQEKEEEIKENIKEVEAMPVILTVGV